MSVKEHGELISTDHPSGDRGNHVIEGFTAVANEAARVAIVQTAADRSRVVYQTGGAFPGWYIGKGSATGDDWRALSLATADTIGLYVRDADGVDTNDGSSGSPLKTVTEALRRTPHDIRHAVVIHMGNGSYTLDSFDRSTSAPLAFVGDGGGTGDGFTVTQAAELADTGTTAAQIVKVGGGLTPDAWIGHTVEITAGPGVGQRAMIKQNTATAYTFAKNFAVAPTAASTYRLVRPAVTLTFAASVQISAPSAPNGGFTAAADAPAIVFAQVKIATTTTLSQLALDAIGVYYGVELDTTTAFILQASLPQFYGKETLFDSGAYPVDLFGASANADWIGWGVYCFGATWPAVGEFVQTNGYVVSENPISVGVGAYLTIGGGRVVVSDANAAVTASFAGTFVAQTSGVAIENTGAGPAVEARDNGTALVAGSLTLTAPTGALLKSRRGGVIVAGAIAGTAGGLVADAQGGQIYFTAAPTLDGASPGSDYAAGIASPLLAGKAAFAANGDGISNADGSLIVRNN